MGLKPTTAFARTRTYAHLLPYSEDELLGMLLNALPADPNPDPKNERKTALDGLQNGMRSPLQLEERPLADREWLGGRRRA